MNDTIAVRGNEAQDDYEIDLVRVWGVLRSHLFLLVAVGLVFSLLAAAYTKFWVKPRYRSSAQMLVMTKETTLASLADLQIGSQLTNDYSILILSRSVMEDTIEALDLKMSVKELSSKVSISNPSDTRILVLTVTDTDPVRAQQIVDKLADVSSGFIAKTMDGKAPKIFEKGEVMYDKVSPSLKGNVLKAFILGLVLCAALLVINELLNDALQTEDDITRYLDLPILATVPVKPDETEVKHKKKNDKKKESEARS